MYLGSKFEDVDGEYELTDLEIQQLKVSRPQKPHNHPNFL